MRLNIPFYKNDEEGNQCVQVAMKTVLKYFLKKDYSLDKLDKLTGRREGKWTWTFQMVPVLHDLGLKVKFYSKEDIEPYLEGEPFIRKHFGKDAGKVLKHSDVDVIANSARNTLKYNVFEKKVLSFDEIEQHIKENHVSLVVIDHNKIVGKKGLYQGHFVVITGFDKDYVYYHEPGPKNPEPNKKILKEVFIEAWDANGTDNDIVIVFGRRN